MRLFACLLCLYVPLTWAQSCVVEGGSGTLHVKICQQNRSIPQGLFKDNFCRPQIKDMDFKVEFADLCPTGAVGYCEGAHTSGVPYQQDIYYYTVSSDVAFLKAACEASSKGAWRTLEQ